MFGLMDPKEMERDDILQELEGGLAVHVKELVSNTPDGYKKAQFGSRGKYHVAVQRNFDERKEILKEALRTNYNILWYLQ